MTTNRRLNYSKLFQINFLHNVSSFLQCRAIKYHSFCVHDKSINRTPKGVVLGIRNSPLLDFLINNFLKKF